jgi:hypothetical protein
VKLLSNIYYLCLYIDFCIEKKKKKILDAVALNNSILTSQLKVFPCSFFPLISFIGGTEEEEWEASGCPYFLHIGYR